jgi:hypothetical protein
MRLHHVARLLTASLAVGGFMLSLNAAAASTPGLPAAPLIEAWYQPNPSCTSLVGCVTPNSLPAGAPTAAPTHPFPDGTLHIAASGTVETARSYLSFPLDSTGGTPTAATLDVPLDAATQDGDLRSSTAKIQACLAISAFGPVRGSLDAPPAIDCDVHADVLYVATPTPHLHADLRPLLAGASSTFEVVLLPDATKLSPTDMWRVVFSAHDRPDAAKTAPALLTVERPEPTQQASEPPSQLPPEPVGDAPAPVFAPPAGFSSLPGITAATPLGAPPTPQAAVAAPVAPLVPSGQVAPSRTFGYAYPLVWLLPLALICLVPLVARALTKELTLPASPSNPS